MKKLILILIVALMMSSCLGQFAQTVMLKDSKGNQYSVSVKYENGAKELGMSIYYENKHYECEVIRDKEFTADAISYEIDLSLLDKSGQAVILYKGTKYTCLSDNSSENLHQPRYSTTGLVSLYVFLKKNKE